MAQSLNEVVEEFAEYDEDGEWAVAWTHEGDEVVCVKPARDPWDELKDVSGLVDFMAERGFRLGYAPGGNASDPQYQFKRRD